MTTNAYSPPREKLRLKEPTGWFAAGSGFQRAITELSDGAFKLFAYLCLLLRRALIQGLQNGFTQGYCPDACRRQMDLFRGTPFGLGDSTEGSLIR